jgi:hypothetical protein
MLISPYKDHPKSQWLQITKALVGSFPLTMEDLVGIVEDAWSDLYTSSFGKTGLKIGSDILLPAQATGVILEKLIAVHISKKFSGWRGGREKYEKDIIFENELKYSFEIKTSSSRSGLYGNRSTGHRAEGRTKFCSGYYLVVNYKLPREGDLSREIQNIRFGWIDDEDWVGQAQPTGQQASIGGRFSAFETRHDQRWSLNQTTMLARVP